MKSEILKRFEDMEDHRVEGRIIHPLRNIIFITVVGASAMEPDSPVHIVSAWIGENLMTLAQARVATKRNEISAIRELLEILELNGAAVTIDAMGCQVKIAERIVGKGADYVLALKMNQSTLRRDADLSFDKLPCCAEITTEETDHGRVEVSRNCLSINKCCFGVPFFAKKSASKSLPPHFFRNRDAVGSVNTNCYWG